MRRYQTTNKPMASINVVPYIDVMLVLLIIFMVTTPLITKGVEVSLPKITATNNNGFDKNTNDPAIITVKQSGEIFVGDNKNPTTNKNELIQQILKKLKNSSKTMVYIKGDKNTKHGNIIKAVGWLQEAGITEVSIRYVE